MLRLHPLLHLPRRRCLARLEGPLRARRRARCPRRAGPPLGVPSSFLRGDPVPLASPSFPVVGCWGPWPGRPGCTGGTAAGDGGLGADAPLRGGSPLPRTSPSLPRPLWGRRIQGFRRRRMIFSCLPQHSSPQRPRPSRAPHRTPRTRTRPCCPCGPRGSRLRRSPWGTSFRRTLPPLPHSRNRAR